MHSRKRRINNLVVFYIVVMILLLAIGSIMILLEESDFIYMEVGRGARAGNRLFNGYVVFGIDAILLLLFIFLKPWKKQ